MIVKKKTILMIMLKNKNNNPINKSSEELNVSIQNIRDGELIQVKWVMEDMKYRSLPVDVDIT